MQDRARQTNRMAQAQKSILITGCSTGIGRDAAETLHRKGWRVFAACRQQQDVEALKEQGLIDALQLDYEDEAMIQAAVDEVLGKTGGTLNALFNNGA